VRRAAFVLGAIVALASLDGCTAIGLGVGSQIPHFEPITKVGSRVLVTRGDAVRVQLTNGDVVRGAAVEVGETSLTVLDDDDHDRVIDDRNIASIDKRRGSEWMTTMIAGIVVDVVITVSLIVANALGAFNNY